MPSMMNKAAGLTCKFCGAMLRVTDILPVDPTNPETSLIVVLACNCKTVILEGTKPDDAHLQTVARREIERYRQKYAGQDIPAADVCDLPDAVQYRQTRNRPKNKIGFIM